MISVIIPAHNESAVIGRSLGALLEGARAGEMEVIVVCNGCGDDTAERARRAGEGVRVIETPVASKTHALNLGDAAASGFPRFYADADVLLTADAVRCIARRLEEGPALAAAPSIRLNLDGASWAVRAFYDVDSRLPSHREGIGGSGVYALTAAGRARFQRFPAITADDAFVRRQFTPAERVTVAEASSLVSPPRTLWGLVKIKSRSHLGNYEMAAGYPELSKNTGEGNGRALLRLALRPGMWPRLAVYALVKSLARLRAYRKHRAGVRGPWERDDTSRGRG